MFSIRGDVKDYNWGPRRPDAVDAGVHRRPAGGTVVRRAPERTVTDGCSGPEGDTADRPKLSPITSPENRPPSSRRSRRGSTTVRAGASERPRCEAHVGRAADRRPGRPGRCLREGRSSAASNRSMHSLDGARLPMRRKYSSASRYGFGRGGLHADDRVAAIQLIHEQQSHAQALVGQLPEAIDRANDAGSMTRVMSESEIAAYRSAAADFPADIGVLMTPLLDFVTLLPGDAVYLAPGIPHSYVRGIGFEVMTSSDNVLRLGLTNKPVFVDRALDILDFDTDPQFMHRLDIDRSGRGRFSAGSGHCRILTVATGEYRLVVAIAGEVDVAVGGQTRTATQGRGVVVTAGEPDAVVSTQGMAIVSLLPPPPKRVPTRGHRLVVANLCCRRWSGALVPVETLPSAWHSKMAAVVSTEKATSTNGERTT